MADGTIGKVNSAGIQPTAKTSTSLTEAAKTVDPAKPESVAAGKTAVRDFLNERGAQLPAEATPQQMRESLGKLVGENRPINGAELEAADKILDAAEPTVAETTPTTTKTPVDQQTVTENREKSATIDSTKRAELDKKVPTTSSSTKTDANTAIVAPGDSLSKIAKQHVNADGTPVTVKQLLSQKENEKFRANPDLIHPGQKVTLPAGAKLRDAPTTPTTDTKAPETKTQTTETKTTTPATDTPDAAKQAEIDADAKTIYDKGVGTTFGTGEKTIFEKLEKYAGDPKAMKALQESYAKQYPGRDMRTDVANELNDGWSARGVLEGRRALALIDGDVPKANAIRVQEAFTHDGAAEQIKVLESVPPEQRQAVAAAFQKENGVSLESFILAAAKGSTKDKAKMLDLAKLFGLAVDGKKTAA